MITDMLMSILTILPCLFYIAVGSYCIQWAIDYYKKQRYFMFGWMIMFAVFEAAYIFRTVFKY